MRRDETTSPSDLDRPEGNDLLSNYDSHDVGDMIFKRRVEDQLGYAVEDWGIDMRHDDEGGIVYDDKMDYRVFTHDDKLIGLVDVKTKTSAKWMGMFNLRHLEHYREHAEEFEVPTFVVMFQVHDGAVVDEFTFDVTEEVHDSKNDDFVSQFPDGNEKALIPHESRREWINLVAQLSFQT